MSAIKMTDGVFSVGVKDPSLRVFDIVMETKYGTTYNSYLIKSDKVALIDTVKKGFTEEFLVNIEQITPVSSIDYLVVNHTEPDHSGSIGELLSRNPKLRILCAGAALPFVKNTINIETDITTVKDDATLDLGGKKLIFKIMPYMHWPDTMMEYLEDDGILFSCDGFAAHLAEQELYADVAKGDVDFEFRYYYDAIMRPFSGYIRRNLPKLDKFDLKMIAPSHGPIYRDNPGAYIQRYKDWTTEKPGAAQRVALFYASNYGNTELIAKSIAGRLTDAGLSVSVNDMTSLEAGQAKDLIEESGSIVIGTPTFNGDAPKPVWDLVGLFSTVYSIGKKAAVFGSYGWSGEGAKLVSERLSGQKLKVFPDTYRVRLVPSAQEIGGVNAFVADLLKFFRDEK